MTQNSTHATRIAMNFSDKMKWKSLGVKPCTTELHVVLEKISTRFYCVKVKTVELC